jgi:hypothetical protein
LSVTSLPDIWRSTNGTGSDPGSLEPFPSLRDAAGEHAVSAGQVILHQLASDMVMRAVLAVVGERQRQSPGRLGLDPSR